MEIDETFSSLEEIQKILEAEGLTWRISIDDDDIEEEEICASKNVLEFASFSADADQKEVEKWEADLPDIDEKEETDELENFNDQPTETKLTSEEKWKTALENAVVVYFDTFLKKSYTKTLIFQKEDGENEAAFYRLIGFCEAPMA
ncbi:hypothetical protein LJC08_02925 [Methanimicrococcus sp. OttesenSCG-928-J09]|nr:hypothetical protein [Methanimicrococcus sp. OttesenSCG-928-J09]